MTLAVYVAGASAEPERVRAAMNGVRAIGARVTCDWLAAIEAAGAANEDLTEEQRKHYALEDLAAVRSADVVWLLAPPRGGSAGAWVELGAALAWRSKYKGTIAIIVSGAASKNSIFCALADYEYATDAEALRALDEMAAFR